MLNTDSVTTRARAIAAFAAKHFGDRCNIAVGVDSLVRPAQPTTIDQTGVIESIAQDQVISATTPATDRCSSPARW